MPPEQPIKFRCDRCGQLLGVSPARAGRPVKCPKCGAGLMVPAPGDPEPDPSDPEGSTATATATSTEGPKGPPSSGFFDAVDLDQDDLRNLFPVDLGEDREDEESLPFFESDAEDNPDFEDETDDDDDAIDPEIASTPSPGPPKGPGQGLIIEDVEGAGTESISALLAERAGGDGQSAELEPGVTATSRSRASRDVLVPRMALLAWSLFVLIALFLAFVAGLLVGHFVWRG